MEKKNNKLTLKECEELYTCNICNQIYTNPVKLPNCGHYNCDECLKQMIKTQNCKKMVKCPYCTVESEINSLKPDEELMTTETKIQCECGKKFKVDKLQKHLDKCKTI